MMSVHVRNFMVGEYGLISSDGKLTMAGMVSRWHVSQLPHTISFACAFEVEGLTSSLAGSLHVRGPLERVRPTNFQLEQPPPKDEVVGLLLWPFTFTIINKGMITFELRFQDNSTYLRRMPVYAEGSEE